MRSIAFGRRRPAQWAVSALAAATVAVVAVSGSASSFAAAAPPATTAWHSPQASAIAAIVRQAMRTYHLRAVIVRVTATGS
jgi:hypothetical protein